MKFIQLINQVLTLQKIVSQINLVFLYENISFEAFLWRQL